MMNKYIAAVSYLLLVVSQVHAWLGGASQTRKILVTRCWMADVPVDGTPCWEDLYDDDCVMSNAAAARFVAADWIKSMPCGQGIQDCDFPEDLKAPETRPEAGIDHVDVMDMLGLKRAKSVDGK